MFSRGGQPSSKGDDNSAKGTPRGEEHMVSFMGPDRNIMLPANGDEALKRLLSEKGKDPYRYLLFYKKSFVLETWFRLRLLTNSMFCYLF